MRKALIALGILVGGAVLTAAFLLYIYAPRLKREARLRTQDYLQQRFKSAVEFSDFHISLYPVVHITIEGLTLRHEGRTDIPPLLQVKEIALTAELASLFKPRPEITSVTLTGLQVNTPPKVPGGPPLIHGTDQDLAKKYPILIDEIHAPNALVTLLRYQSDKPPNQFEIHDLILRNFSFDQPASLHAVLTNPKPTGLIYCDGQFGPWDAEEPRNTPVDANFTFDNADLGTLKGIKGILSSKGKFSGLLDYLDVEGTTDTPDFALRISNHPMDLRTEYKAIVDGTNGDTILTSVTAHFLHTTLSTHGSVVDVYPNVKGRTISLDATATNARIEDLLDLAVKADKPIMTGSAKLKTKIVIPEKDEDVIQKLQLDGQFGVGQAHFSSDTIQGKVDALSRHGQGRPKDEDVSGEASDFSGSFKMDEGTITFSHLAFNVEGASIALAGSYSLDSGVLDFRGKLRTEAKVSQMVTGWKSVMLKPFDHFFKDKQGGGGAEIPIKITGTRDHPAFGPDFRDPKNKE